MVWESFGRHIKPWLPYCVSLLSCDIYSLVLNGCKVVQNLGKWCTQCGELDVHTVVKDSACSTSFLPLATAPALSTSQVTCLKFHLINSKLIQLNLTNSKCRNLNCVIIKLTDWACSEKGTGKVFINLWKSLKVLSRHKRLWPPFIISAHHQDWQQSPQLQCTTFSSDADLCSVFN